jgi:hypothetical protein
MYGLAGGYLLDVKVNDFTYPVGEDRLKSLRLHEWSTRLCAMAELAIDDRGNALTEMIGLTGTDVFSIGVGDNLDNIVYHDFKLFRITAARSGSDSHLMKLYLISDKARGLFTPARFRSYPTQKISDIVKSIAAELGMEYEVEETDGTYDTFCPGWTFGQLLGWLANVARSLAHGTAGFLFFVDMDDKLHFYSAEWAKKQKSVINVVRKDLDDPDQYDEKDVDLGPYRVYMNPMFMGVQGGWGLTGAYFDFENAQFVDDPITLDGTSRADAAYATPGYTHHSGEATTGTTMLGLVDNVVMRKNDLDPANVFVAQGVASGADDVSRREAALEAQMLRPVNGMVKDDFLVVGDLRVRAGSLVSEQVGSPIPENIINQVFSGKWVVERVTHQLMPQFVTRFMGFRSGISGSDDAELVVPPGGVVR